jgi:hypothetical protein
LRVALRVVTLAFNVAPAYSSAGATLQREIESAESSSLVCPIGDVRERVMSRNEAGTV